jgi:hypothetical protein
MQSLRLELSYDDDAIHPMHRFVCESPHVRRETLLEGRQVGDGRTMLFFVNGDQRPYKRQLAAREDVLEFDVTPEDDDSFYAWVRVANREAELPVLDAFDRDTLVVVPPVEFREDRTAHFSVVGSAADLRGVVDDLSDGVTATVRRVGDPAAAVDDGLTDRQREAMAAAWDVGYYDVPRSGGIEAVAAELDCATSTASDLLRRGEASLVGDALGE